MAWYGSWQECVSGKSMSLARVERVCFETVCVSGELNLVYTYFSEVLFYDFSQGYWPLLWLIPGQYKIHE